MKNSRVCANSLVAMTSAFQVDDPGSIPGWRTKTTMKQRIIKLA